MRPTIKAIDCFLPPYSYDNEEVCEYVKKWLEHFSAADLEKSLNIFQGSNIRERHSILPLETIFTRRSLEEFTQAYKEKSIEFSVKAVENILRKADVSGQEIDMVISTSCTGFMIPTFDCYMCNRLGFRNNVKRMPITELGCLAGVSALIFAESHLKAFPDDKVLIVSLEFPTNTIQLNNFNWDNIIATALFGDGISCMVLENAEKGLGIVDSEIVTLPHTERLIGYKLASGGFLMNLSVTLPKKIKSNFRELVGSILQRNQLDLTALSSLLIHPGGIRIVEELAILLKDFGHDLKESKKIMSTYGNMSSATIGFVLQEYLQNQPQTEAPFLALSFGPGFSAHQVLLKRYQ